MTATVMPAAQSCACHRMSGATLPLRLGAPGLARSARQAARRDGPARSRWDGAGL